eukprot:2962348-Pyramimonas_sp.AAC.1
MRAQWRWALAFCPSRGRPGLARRPATRRHRPSCKDAGPPFCKCVTVHEIPVHCMCGYIHRQDIYRIV